VIGALGDLPGMLRGERGTRISTEVEGVVLAQGLPSAPSA
jgi:hypothetical protein